MLNPGDVIRDDYTIDSHLNRGMMANAYTARSSSLGQKVFFKEYISPKPSVEWFHAFVQYQKSLIEATRSTPAANFCILPLATFECRGKKNKSGKLMKTPSLLYQAFPLVVGGQDLEQWNAKSNTWDDRLTLARVFASAMVQLHKVNIIHGDLKPPNVMLVPKPSARVGYQLQLIDMDFSMRADIRAPWDGYSGYVGTPGYMSPEHMRGQVPALASDVFTSSLILHEVLCGSYPFGDVAADEILSLVEKDAIPSYGLLGSLGADEKDDQLRALMRLALHADPRRRPTMENLAKALLGSNVPDSELPDGTAPPPAKPVAPPPKVPPSAPRSPAPAPSVPPSASPTPVPPSVGGGQKLRLQAGGQEMSISTDLEVGRSVLQRFGADAQFASSHQYTLRKQGSQWIVVPNRAATNDTLINSVLLQDEHVLKSGDVLSVGNAAKGIVKLPLNVDC